MKPFKHFDAESVEEGLALLGRHGVTARLLAGGTDLLGVLKSEILPDYPEVVINLKTIPGLDGIEEDETGLKIGAMVRLVDIVESSIVKKYFPALALAAESVGSPELRNMGTLGGNLCQDTRCWYYRYPDKMGGQIPCYRKGKGPCHAIKGDNRYHAVLEGRKCYAVCSSDVAIALAALQAEVITAKPAGGRTIPLSGLYHSLGTVLDPGEIVTQIRIPIPSPGAVQRFSKFRLRESIDFAIVSVAVLLELTDGICRDACIVLGAVAPTPYRAVAAEKILMGKSLDETLVSKAVGAALQDAKPLSKNAYKIEIAKTLVERVLRSS